MCCTRPLTYPLMLVPADSAPGPCPSPPAGVNVRTSKALPCYGLIIDPPLWSQGEPASQWGLSLSTVCQADEEALGIWGPRSGFWIFGFLGER